MQLLCPIDSDVLIWTDKKKRALLLWLPLSLGKAKPSLHAPVSARLSLGSSLALEPPALQIPSGNADHGHICRRIISFRAKSVLLPHPLN